MTPKSCKAKGRKACQEVKALLHRFFPTLSDDDIQVTPSGVRGEDLVLSPEARALFNYTSEVKNVEAINVWEAYAQAQAHHQKRPTTTPLLIFRRNKSKLMVCLDFETFLRLVADRESGRDHA